MTPQGERVLRTQWVAEKVGISRTTLWRWVSSGYFPAPRIVGPTEAKPIRGWLESDIDAWLNDRPVEGGES